MKMLNQIKAFLKRRKANRFYRSLISQGSLCFDIGANKGDRTEIYLGAGATVVAVEPQPECIKTLAERFKGNPHLKLVQKAAHHEVTRLDLRVCNMNEVSSLSGKFIHYYERYDYLNWEHSIRIETTTPDLLIKEFGLPQYCKIDVEGWEENVLKGLSKPVPVIEFEFNAPFIEDAIRCIEIIASLGNYNYNYSIYETYTPVLPQWLPANDFIMQFGKIPSEILTGDIYCRLE